MIQFTSILLLAAIREASPQFSSSWSFRNGGFPKFPPSKPSPQWNSHSLQCGTRSVSHQPLRTGGATAKIVGGSAANYGAYPWQVEIQAYRPEKRKFEHHCGGAVVGERVVLTAAHCITNLEHADKIRLIVGKHDLNQKDHHERSFKAEKTIIHPQFRKMGPHSNDIALIKVKAVNDNGFTFNSHVQPICLPEEDSQIAGVGEWCTVTGWGAQKPEDLESLSGVLKAASVPLLDLSTCRQSGVYGGRVQSILDSMLCAGPLEGGVDACGGDSGGPLACQVDGHFILTGVVSWGDGCAKKNRPGVYTRVAHFTPWIHETLHKLGA
ncbi:serine protease 27 [Nilaparvata lugens]|uniref:Trypsin-8 n=1 Tax=Nilaparvata lugens TaxID=108931 RepID=A0A068F691_NILLU|nr:serine protease 27 [Nilaparvata lugens]XP_022187034.1 serine protease 27 [Nilaparvata lugens]XP_039296842.1 serine protease 27 [Nilaparvata lugens]XP_039296868.1 serine protease 27 [Nilaparvata lugens]AID60342.1 trypsin-8 [Nilaparvata lugens]QQS74763.1 trypsin-8 [Nilaparvata lugens]